jgi:GAF domain-containing protein
MTAKKALEWSLLANESVMRQNGILDSLNAKLQAMYKVASKLTAMTGEADPCGQAVQSLVKEMGFGSAQVWLLDPGGREFHCADAAGYPEAQRNFIMSARFRLQDGADNPHGLLIQAMEQRQTLIVNDMQDVLPRVSPRVRDFMTALNISSFIMTPLIDGDRLIGILAGEYHRGEQIESNDRIIFQSLAQVLTATLGRIGIKPWQGTVP